VEPDPAPQASPDSLAAQVEALSDDDVEALMRVL
jgi:hypothetical protein